MIKSLRNTLATLGIAAAVGATAVPMLSIWTQKESYESLNDNDPLGALIKLNAPYDFRPKLSGPILVDFNDGTSDADIQAFATKYGLKLAPNSIEAKDNRLYRVIEGKADLETLRHDSRVQVAEPEITFHLEQTAVKWNYTLRHRDAGPWVRVIDPTVETTMSAGYIAII